MTSPTSPTVPSVSFYEVGYRVVTGIDGTTVASGTTTVAAASPAQAGAAAVAWAHGNDPHADPRLDPRVEIDSVEDSPAIYLEPEPGHDGVHGPFATEQDALDAAERLGLPPDSHSLVER